MSEHEAGEAREIATASEVSVRSTAVTPPLIFRAMKAAGGLPITGTAGLMLGARVPRDIAPDSQGNVHPRGGGMSVQPRLLDIPAMFLPRRLKHLNRNAAGSNHVVVWRMGSGPFAPSAVANRLYLRPDDGTDARHGVIEPAAPMQVSDYQSALEATRDQWVNGEP